MGSLPKYEKNLLKIGFNNTYMFFRDFQPLNGLFHTSSQMANFGQFLAKMDETGFFSKKRLEHFFRLSEF